MVTPDPVPVTYHCLNKSHLPFVCVSDFAGVLTFFALWGGPGFTSMAAKTLEPASLDLGLPCESEFIWEFTPPCALYCSTSWTLTLDLPQMLELFCGVAAVLPELACCLASFIPVAMGGCVIPPYTP